LKKGESTIMSDAFTALLTRIPTSTPAGKTRVIRNIAAAGFSLQGVRERIAARDDLTPKGRGQMVAQHIKSETGPALARARRQFEYHERALARQRDALRGKVIGESRTTDAEWRSYLRSLPIAERTQKVFTDPAARAAALREPGLVELPSDVIDRALDIATTETIAPTEAAALARREDEQAVHSAMIRTLVNELMNTKFIVESSGDLRSFVSPVEFDQFMAAEVPAPGIVQIAFEEKEADLIAEAA
jgi:hypothetical protein